MITYKVQVVVGKQMSSTTTANCWVNMTGNNGSTGTVHMPKGDLDFRFKVNPFLFVLISYLFHDLIVIFVFLGYIPSLFYKKNLYNDLFHYETLLIVVDHYS